MQKRAEETREKLLNTAQLLFSQNGYNATGVAEICASAGVSKGAFYHHFSNKQGIFLALLEQWLVTLDTQLKVIRKMEIPFPEQVMEMIDMLPIVFADASGQIPMFLEFWVQASRDPIIWQKTISPYRYYQQFFSKLVQEGIDQGSLKENIDPEIFGQTIMSLVIGIFLQGLLDPNGTDWVEVTRKSMTTLLDSIRKEKT